MCNLPYVLITSTWRSTYPGGRLEVVLQEKFAHPPEAVTFYTAGLPLCVA